MLVADIDQAATAAVVRRTAGAGGAAEAFEVPIANKPCEQLTSRCYMTLNPWRCHSGPWELTGHRGPLFEPLKLEPFQHMFNHRSLLNSPECAKHLGASSGDVPA